MKKSELKQIISECIREVLSEDPCWSGYEQYGTKKKDGKEVPNCIPKEVKELEEGGGKCTKANTKKTSSDRKDKKWTKCTDGKRIHWGDPNAKTSPGTKRAKNFKKRHGCSTAKPGTPKHAACQDW